MQTKRCTKCKEIKLLSDYSPDRRRPDGRYSACRKCNNSLYKSSSTEAYKKWYQKHKDYFRNRFKEKPEEHQKYLVRMKVNNAINSGKLKRLNCEICGLKAEAHHEDYAKPFLIKWLCKIHHEIEHTKLKQI